MLKNYIKIALRNMQRNKFFILINVMGLALSITCAILIFTTVSYHLSFDNFHKNSYRIYRIVTEQHRDEISYTSGVPNPLGKAFRNDYTFGEKVARIVTLRDEMISVNRGKEVIKFKEEGGVAFTEPEFFQIFNYPLLRGVSALAEPNTAIITKKTAEKYFGDEDPINKVFRLDNKIDLKITGVLKDLPANTETQTGIYISYISVKDFEPWYYNDDTWGGIDNAMQCFVLMRPNVSIPQVEALMSGYVKKFRPTSKNVHHYKFQKLSDIHFDARYGGPMEKRNLWILSIIGVFLIITACVNFINLATAQALKRSKEVGVRKVLGSMQGQLFWQFISETAILCILGTILAYGFSILFLPYINTFFSTRMSINIFSSWQLSVFIVALTVIITFLAGSYPGLVLSGFRPILALKGKISQQAIGGFNVRRTLIITQLSISMLLIIGMLVIIQQMQYTQKADLGFNKEAIVMVPMGEDPTGTVMTALQNQLTQIAGVEKVSLCYAAPASQNSWNNAVKFDGQSEDVNFRTSFKSADEQYISLFGLDLIAGRNLLPSDTVKEFLVNEAFLHKVSIKSPQEALGKIVTANGGSISGPIVGVINDFHNLSLHEDIDAVAITTLKERYSQYAIKINLANMKPALTAIEKAWSAKYPDRIFEYQFLDESIAKFYETDQHTLTLVEVFSLIAIFIGCLGLFGLVSFMVIQKTKEIGIRKVLGGTAANIIWIFGKEFGRLVFVAFAIAAPAGWWLMNNWLQDFEFKINISAWTFIFSLLASLLIVCITVGLQALKATLMNPVKSLRSE